VYDEREKEGERKAIDHIVVPFILFSLPLELSVGKPRASTKITLFAAHRGKGNLPLAGSASMRKYRDEVDFGEVKFLLICV
jgi:hypothetical protein